MVINDILAYRLGKEYEKKALKEAENARLVKMALQHRRKQSLIQQNNRVVKDQWKNVFSSIRRDNTKRSESALSKQHVTESR